MMASMARIETHVDELRGAAGRSDDETEKAIYMVGAAICERLEQLTETTKGGGAVWNEAKAIKGILTQVLSELRRSR